jgi:hypothetical protein
MARLEVAIMALESLVSPPLDFRLACCYMPWMIIPTWLERPNRKVYILSYKKTVCLAFQPAILKFNGFLSFKHT